MSADTASDPAPVDAEPGVHPEPPSSAPAPDGAPPTATDATAAAIAKDQIECARPPAPAFLFSPPDSNDAPKSDSSDSELSDLDEEPILDGPSPVPIQSHVEQDDDAVKPEKRDAEQTPPTQENEEEDIGEVLPDHWSGTVPVFRPTMRQFKDFQAFMKKVDRYGMKSGIIKVIPPPEWKNAQPPLDDLVKQIKVREPIKQDIMGSNGTYRQVNILHGRSYNLPQWRQLCEQSEHQPPARRGERRANAERPKTTRTRAAPVSKSAKPSTPKKRGRGRPARGRGKQNKDEDRPMTPVSPKEEVQDVQDEAVNSIEQEIGDEIDEDYQPTVGRMGARPSKPKTQSVSARRKYSRREGSAMIDEAAFKDFDYRMKIPDYTPERCEELERAYWKTLTYAPPLYGADMMGTLFDDRTEIWNLNKLPNILDVLGTKVPGVNTAYLYLGMWKATFAWHLEDVDLYSINYLHFGAPKQWYSISQADARRFEAAMKNIWPTDAKACDQFLRHKGFLISPQHLLSHYGIKVNKVVSYPGEFVVTYPYGYHSGYNLGYNCAEAVNFALESWLPMGKIAKKCECAQAQDSVWINVHEIERKLRGEETEYEETEDEEDEDGDIDGDMSGLPTPPASHGVRFKDASRKRKRGPAGKKEKIKVKKIKLRLKSKVEPPCCLCPHDISGFDMVPTEDGRKAHRMCALYLPETYIDTVDGKEVVCNVTAIPKDRLDLKCLFCRSKKGACFQCSKKKCARAYHATCAAAAGVFVEDQEVPVFGEDGTEFKEQAFEFSCRFHRSRRDKKVDSGMLEADERIRDAAKALQKDVIYQFQYIKGDIFAGMVVENRPEEEMVLIDVLPNGNRLEVEWKWLVLPDPSDYRLPKASDKAIPLPTSRKAKERLNAKRPHDEKPRKDDEFAEGYTWAEFHFEPVANKDQCKVDFAKSNQIWFYLGKTSTEARAQFTEDPTNPRHNPQGNYLDTLPKPPKPPKPTPAPKAPPRAHGFQTTVVGGFSHSFNHNHANSAVAGASGRTERPYIYKPKTPIEPYRPPKLYTTHKFAPTPAQSAHSLGQGPPQMNSHYPAQSSHLNHAHPTHPTHPAHPTPQHQSQHPYIQQGHPPAVSHSQGYAGTPAMERPLPISHPRHTAPQPHRHSWHVHSSVYHKYPFFQVNHNRDASKYRTPYSPRGGFTNGYEGDMRAHLMSRQSDLIRRPSFNTLPSPVAGGHQQQGPGQSQSVGGFQQPTNMPMQPAHPQNSYIQPSNAARLPPIASVATGQVLHPAIKAQYTTAFQQAQQSTMQPPRAKPPPAQRSYKVPPKESPVPLPANFLAAMSSSAGGTHASSSAPASSAASGQLPPMKTTYEQPRLMPRPMQHAQAHATHASGPQTSGPQANQTPIARDLHPAVSAQLPSMPSMAPPRTLLQNTAPISGSLPAAVDPGSAAAQTASVPTNTVHHQAGFEPQGAQGGSRGNVEQQFSDVSGTESRDFVARMMENLKRASQREATDGSG